MRNLLSLLLFGVFLSSSARAVSVNSINVQTFNPSTGDHYVLLEDAFRSEWPKNSKLYLGANYNYVSEPFVALSNGVRDFTVINSIQTFDLMIGFKASARFGLFFGVPIHFIQYPDAPKLSILNHSATALGDMKILGKIRVTNDDSVVHVALIPEIHLPTGNTENFVSDASTYLALRGVLERQFEKFTLNLNLGFGAASNSIYSTPIATNVIDFRKRLNFGVGGFMPFTDRWGMSVEFNSLNMIPFDTNINPNELYAGLRHVLSEDAILTFGASLGKIGGASGQNFRAILGLRFNLHDEDPNSIVHPLSSPAPLAMNGDAPKPAPLAAPRVVMKSKQIEISTPINFQENSSLLTPDGKDLLDEVADVISRNTGSFKKIEIDGHTNNKGNAKHNLWLSLERAKSVKHYLVGKGISQNVLEARGFGQMKPKVPYTNSKAMDINRRVEFNIVQ